MFNNTCVIMASFIIDNVSWACKTYEEIQEVAEQDGSIVIIPIGSTEQHGYHLPVITDSALADAVAHEGAKRSTPDIPVLVTPPIWMGHSPAHIDVGGTISLQFRTMLNLIEDVSATALNNGFDSILLLNGHGDNTPLVSGATYTIGSDHYPKYDIFSIDYYTLAADIIDSVRDSDTGGMSHGGEFETSLMKHLYPSLVNDSVMESEYRHTPYDHGWKDMFSRGGLSRYRETTDSNEYSESGAEGDPHLGSEEKGEAIFDHLADELRTLLLDIYNNTGDSTDE